MVPMPPPSSSSNSSDHNAAAAAAPPAGDTPMAPATPAAAGSSGSSSSSELYGGFLEAQLAELATPAEMMAGYKPSMPPQQLQVGVLTVRGGLRWWGVCMWWWGGGLYRTVRVFWTLAVGVRTVLPGVRCQGWRHPLRWWRDTNPACHHNSCRCANGEMCVCVCGGGGAWVVRIESTLAGVEIFLVG